MKALKALASESRTFLPLIIPINHVLKAVIDGFLKVGKITVNKNGTAVVATETTLREDVPDNRKRRDVMGDKGGKKDKEKSQKQSAEKQKQKSKGKFDKQPKRKP
jgi:hypothetical protein